MQRRWRTIMHGRVEVYEQLDLPYEDSLPIWRVRGSVRQSLAGATCTATALGEALGTCFEGAAAARRLVESRVLAAHRIVTSDAAALRATVEAVACG